MRRIGWRPSRLVSRRRSVAPHILRRVAQVEFQDADCIVRRQGVVALDSANKT